MKKGEIKTITATAEGRDKEFKGLAVKGKK